MSHMHRTQQRHHCVVQLGLGQLRPQEAIDGAPVHALALHADRRGPHAEGVGQGTGLHRRGKSGVQLVRVRPPTTATIVVVADAATATAAVAVKAVTFAEFAG